MADQGSNETVGASTIAPATGGAPQSGGAAFTIAPTGDGPVDNIVKQVTALGEKIIRDLTYAQALASYVDPATGQQADPNGALALGALIPLVTLIVNGPPVATAAAGGKGAAVAVPSLPDPHVITDIQKARIVLLRFQDPKFKAALAPLAQDIQQQAGSLLGIGGVVVKVLGLAGVAVP